MNIFSRYSLLIGLLMALSLPTPTLGQAGGKRFLYVVTPGIRNYLEYGGAGILLFDIDDGHKFVRRIQTTASLADKPDNIKGVCASARTGRLYFTTPKKLYCFDLFTERTLWEVALPKGCDRPSITPDGKTLYVPSFEADLWHVVDAADGRLIESLKTDNRTHNTVGSADGTRMYLGGLSSPMLFVADTATGKLLPSVGPFGGAIRPLTVTSDNSRAYVCVNGLLGFEVADLKERKVIHRVEVEGFKQGPVKRHGCPSHGIGITPDESQIWLCDSANSALHVFDATTSPPKQLASITVRDQPGWITFSLDGRFAYPSSGEVIDVKTRQVVAALTDEEGRAVGSEKMVEIHIGGNHLAVRNGDQFGIGRRNEMNQNTLSEAEKMDGWKLLFDGKTTQGWRGYRMNTMPAGWSVENGALIRVKGGQGGKGAGGGDDIVTVDSYKNFEFQIEWKTVTNGNSGLLYHVSEEPVTAWHHAPEFQILDNTTHPNRDKRQLAGACYDLYAPSKDVTRPVGQWNHILLRVKDNHVEHWLNGEKIVEYVIGSEDWTRRVAASKFKNMPKFGTIGQGPICLQDHSDRIEFRNIKVRELTP